MNEILPRTLAYCLKCWVVVSVPAHLVEDDTMTAHILCPGCHEIHAEFKGV